MCISEELCFIGHRFELRSEQVKSTDEGILLSLLGQILVLNCLFLGVKNNTLTKSHIIFRGKAKF